MHRQLQRTRQKPRSQRVFALAWLLVALALGLLLGGCGNRGSLYLPDAEESVAPATAVAEPGDPDDDEDDSDIGSGERPGDSPGA